MNREILEFDNEEDWLAERTKDVTSTEASALFSASPYGTEYELYHLKAGSLESNFRDNERVKWGRRLETAIAMGVAEDLGLIVEPFKTYIRLPDIRMGSSFDFKITGITEGWDGDDETYRDLFRNNGPGIMEVKNVDGMVFRRGWIEEEGHVEAPPHIEFQVQHQLEVADLEWSVVAPLINGNTPKHFYRLRDTEIGEVIRVKITEFWQRIADNNPPDPDFEVDADAVARVYLNSNEASVDMSDNEYLGQLCAEHDAAKERKQQAETEQKAKKAEILTIIGENKKIAAPGFKISAGTVAPNPGKLVTPEMVGTRISPRSGYRNVRITKEKAKAEK